jgi:hypothetical protein
MRGFAFFGLIVLGISLPVLDWAQGTVSFPPPNSATSAMAQLANLSNYSQGGCQGFNQWMSDVATYSKEFNFTQNQEMEILNAVGQQWIPIYDFSLKANRDMCAVFNGLVNHTMTPGAQCYTAHAMILAQAAKAMGLVPHFITSPWKWDGANEAAGPHISMLVTDQNSEHCMMENFGYQPYQLEFDVSGIRSANARVAECARQATVAEGSTMSFSLDDKETLLTGTGSAMQKVFGQAKGAQYATYADGSTLVTGRVGNLIFSDINIPTEGNSIYAGLTHQTRDGTLDIGFMNINSNQRTSEEKSLLVHGQGCTPIRTGGVLSKGQLDFVHMFTGQFDFASRPFGSTSATYPGMGPPAMIASFYNLQGLLYKQGALKLSAATQIIPDSGNPLDLTQLHLNTTTSESLARTYAQKNGNFSFQAGLIQANGLTGNANVGDPTQRVDTLAVFLSKDVGSKNGLQGNFQYVYLQKGFEYLNQGSNVQFTLSDKISPVAKAYFSVAGGSGPSVNPFGFGVGEQYQFRDLNGSGPQFNAGVSF